MERLKKFIMFVLFMAIILTGFTFCSNMDLYPAEPMEKIKIPNTKYTLILEYSCEEIVFYYTTSKFMPIKNDLGFSSTRFKEKPTKDEYEITIDGNTVNISVYQENTGRTEVIQFIFGDQVTIIRN